MNTQDVCRVALGRAPPWPRFGFQPERPRSVAQELVFHTIVCNTHAVRVGAAYIMAQGTATTPRLGRGTIRLETLIELRFLNSCFSSLSSRFDQTHSSLSSDSRHPCSQPTLPSPPLEDSEQDLGAPAKGQPRVRRVGPQLVAAAGAPPAPHPPSSVFEGRHMKISCPFCLISSFSWGP